MSDEVVTCAKCGAEQRTDVKVVCGACAGGARSRLHGVRALLGYLRDTTARLGVVERLGGRGGEQPEDRDAAGRLLAASLSPVAAPADLEALEAARAIRHAVLRWSTMLELERFPRPPRCGHLSCRAVMAHIERGPICAMAHARWLELEGRQDGALWLAERFGTVRAYPWAAEACRDLERVTSRGWALVDASPGTGWFAGDCDAAVEPSTGMQAVGSGTFAACGRALYARLDEAFVRCLGCGTVHEVGPRRARLLEAAKDVLMTASEASRALTTLDHEVTPERIRKWKSRGLLEVRGNTAEGRPRYRLGDILERLHRETFGITDRPEGQAS